MVPRGLFKHLQTRKYASWRKGSIYDIPIAAGDTLEETKTKTLAYLCYLDPVDFVVVDRDTLEIVYRSEGDVQPQT